MSDERDPNSPIRDEDLVKAKASALEFLEHQSSSYSPAYGQWLAESIIQLAGEVQILRRRLAERPKCACGEEVPIITICAKCAMVQWCTAFDYPQEPRLTEDEFNAKHGLGKGGM